MISKVITGKTFAGACKYVCMDQKRAVVLETEGVRSYHHKLMAADFEMQRALRPSLGKAVFHCIISFYPGEKVEDKIMAEIANEYLQKMGITNTQFAITKHSDKNHPHLHIIANRVNNNGEAIKDNWIGLRAKMIAQELTKRYGLKEVISKDLSLTNLDALKGKDRARYILYQEILEKLPSCKNVENLKQKLLKQNIETLYKYKEQTNELQGISFKMGKYKFKGCKIDWKFSLGNLEKTIKQMQNVNELKPGNNIISKLPLNNTHPEIRIADNSKNIMDLVMKPEEYNEEIPHELRIEKKPKKKLIRRHL